MNHFSSFGCCVGLGAVLALAPFLAGQQPAGKSQTHPPIQATGCLKRGDQQGMFVVTDRTGTTWELVSGTNEIDLSKHIFQAVNVEGTEVRVPAPRHELRVERLQVLSRSCTR